MTRHKFLDLICYLFFKDNEINVNIPNFCPPVYYSAFQTFYLGSRHIHKEIKLQKIMNEMDNILCKTNLILIRRHTNKYNTFSDVDF